MGVKFNPLINSGFDFTSTSGGGGGVTSVSASSPLASSGGATPNITIQTASGSQAGSLSAADWTTFNNKQPAGNYITALTADITANGPGSAIAALRTIPNKVYVDFISGNDSNTGTIVQPWKTLQHAYNSISPSINEPYVIYLSGGNNSSDTYPITGKADVSIISDYGIQVPGITITSPVGNSNGCTFVNLTFLNPLTWIRNDGNTSAVNLINCEFFSGPVIKNTSTGTCSVLAVNSQFLNSEFQTANGGFAIFLGCTFLGTTTFDDPGSSGFSYIEFENGYSSGAMSFTGLYDPIYFTGFVHDVPFGASVSFSAGTAGPPPLEIDSAGLPPTYTGTPGTITYLSQANAINSQVNVAHGGTGQSSLTANNVILGNGTSAVQFVAPGTSGNVLTSNGTTWTSAAPASGGANTALSNLSSTSINASLNPNASNTFDLGSSNYWGTLRIHQVNMMDSSTVTGLVTTNQSGTFDAGAWPISHANIIQSFGAGLGASADMVISSATGGWSGRVYLVSGGSSSNINSGDVTIASGAGGVTSSNTGSVIISSGNAQGSNNTGNISLNIGTISSGTRGKIKFVDGSEGTAGQVWTSTDTAGNGHWAAPTAASWTKYTVTFSDLTGGIITGGGTISTITVATLPSKTVLQALQSNVSTPFSGSGVTSLDSTLGTNSTTFDNFASITGMTSATTFPQFGAVTYILVSVSGTVALKLQATCNTNISNLSAGSVDIYVQTSTVP